MTIYHASCYVADFPLHSNASKPGDLSLSPMQASILCSILFDILYSYPRSLFEIIPFLMTCSLPFRCKVSFHVFDLCHLCSLPIIALHACFPCSHSLTHHAHLTCHLTPTLSIKPIPSITINNSCVPLFVLASYEPLPELIALIACSRHLLCLHTHHLYSSSP
jgi:hypothetical protein